MNSWYGRSGRSGAQPLFQQSNERLPIVILPYCPPIRGDHNALVKLVLLIERQAQD